MNTFCSTLKLLEYKSSIMDGKSNSPVDGQVLLNSFLYQQFISVYLITLSHSSDALDFTLEFKSFFPDQMKDTLKSEIQTVPDSSLSEAMCKSMRKFSKQFMNCQTIFNYLTTGISKPVFKFLIDLWIAEDFVLQFSQNSSNTEIQNETKVFVDLLVKLNPLVKTADYQDYRQLLKDKTNLLFEKLLSLKKTQFPKDVDFVPVSVFINPKAIFDAYVMPHLNDPDKIDFLHNFAAFKLSPPITDKQLVSIVSGLQVSSDSYDCIFSLIDRNNFDWDAVLNTVINTSLPLFYAINLFSFFGKVLPPENVKKALSAVDQYMKQFEITFNDFQTIHFYHSLDNKVHLQFLFQIVLSGISRTILTNEEIYSCNGTIFHLKLWPTSLKPMNKLFKNHIKFLFKGKKYETIAIILHNIALLKGKSFNWDNMVPSGCITPDSIKELFNSPHIQTAPLWLIEYIWQKYISIESSFEVNTKKSISDKVVSFSNVPSAAVRYRDAVYQNIYERQFYLIMTPVFVALFLSFSAFAGFVAWKKIKQRRRVRELPIVD